jgi:hypothetical protein
MPLSRLIEKLNKYTGRLERGKTEKIKASHVEKVLGKLEKREADLKAKLKAESNEENRARIKKRLRVNKKQAERARWLLKKL